MGLQAKLVSTAVGLTSFAAGWWNGCSSFKVFFCQDRTHLSKACEKPATLKKLRRDSRVGKEMNRPQSLTTDQISAWPAWLGVETCSVLTSAVLGFIQTISPYIIIHVRWKQTHCFNICPADFTNEDGAISVSLKKKHNTKHTHKNLKG